MTRGPVRARCAGPGLVFVGLNPIDFFYVYEINLEMMAILDQSQCLVAISVRVPIDVRNTMRRDLLFLLRLVLFF